MFDLLGRTLNFEVGLRTLMIVVLGSPLRPPSDERSILPPISPPPPLPPERKGVGGLGGGGLGGGVPVRFFSNFPTLFVLAVCHLHVVLS